MLIIRELNASKELDAEAMARLRGGQGSIMEAVREGMAKALKEITETQEFSQTQDIDELGEALNVGNINVM